MTNHELLDHELLGKLLGLKWDDEGYDERSLAMMYSELSLAKNLVSQRMLERGFERMEKDGKLSAEAAARVGTEKE